MTVHDLESFFQKELYSIYDIDEVRAIFRMVVEEVLGIDRESLFHKKEQVITDQQMENIKLILERLKNQEPVQYVLGVAWFYGMKVTVTKDVLIPRPETEEMVRYIAKEVINPSVTILDIGTGSGCIAIGLKKMLPEAIVTAMDISKGALHIARKNSELQKTDVDFIEYDILKWHSKGSNWQSPEKFDIIVSNPPYISILEKPKLAKVVTDYEPEVALFVPGDDLLLFYRLIAMFAKEFLKKNGRLYFEINQEQAIPVIQLLLDRGFAEVKALDDLSGNKRFVKAILPNS